MVQAETRQILEFSVRGVASDGEDLSLEHLDVDVMQKLLQQWKSIIGANVKEPISLKTGSIRISSALVAVVAAPILADLEHYQRGELDEISDPARKEALAELASDAKRGNRIYSISSGGREYLRVDSSNYKVKKRARLVDMATEIEGVVTDAGGQGAQPNIHLDTSRGKCIVAATREQLAGIQGNILYKRILVSVACKYDLVTNTTRDYELKEIVELDDSIDEEALAEAVSRGAVAWKDVKDPSAWLADMRGE